MIVLAIAAMILAVILLAVPALTRAKNNYTRKHDAIILAASIRQYISNQGINYPLAACSPNNSCLYYCDDSNIDTACAFLKYADLSYYNYHTNQILLFITNKFVGGQPMYNNIDLAGNEGMTIAAGWKCTTDHLGVIPVGSGSTNQIISVLISVQTSGGYLDQCYDV